MNRTIQLTDRLYNYILSVSLREPEVLQRLRQETAQLPMAMMQIAPDQGQFIALLVKLINAKRTLELGVFTGYSALWVALALPEDGQVVACDHNSEWTAIAQRYWQEAGVAHKIDLRLAPALETLETLMQSGQAGTFDFAFIDADKRNYPHYYEHCLTLLKPGGLIAIDNVLRKGSVLNERFLQDKATQTIDELNQQLTQDERVDLSLVTIGDGLTLLRKR